MQWPLQTQFTLVFIPHIMQLDVVIFIEARAELCLFWFFIVQQKRIAPGLYKLGPFCRTGCKKK